MGIQFYGLPTVFVQ